MASTFETLFSDNLSQKNFIYHLFFSEGMVTNPAILLVINAVRVFPSLPTGTVPLERDALLPIFVNSFRFAGWTVFLSKSFESKLSLLINY